jgi:hypothetical protein
VVYSKTYRGGRSVLAFSEAKGMSKRRNAFSA